MNMFLASMLIMGLAILGMALGVIFSNKPLQGSCGGLGRVMGEKCEFCNKRGECTRRRART